MGETENLAEEEFGGDHANMTAMRIILTLLFGGLALALFGVAVRSDRGRAIIRRSRPLLTVEEAVRWRTQ